MTLVPGSSISHSFLNQIYNYNTMFSLYIKIVLNSIYTFTVENILKHILEGRVEQQVALLSHRSSLFLSAGYYLYGVSHVLPESVWVSGSQISSYLPKTC